MRTAGRVRLAALALAVGTVALASGPDPVAGHRRIVAALETATARVSSDPVSALASLEAARNAYRTFSANMGSARLASGGARALDAARVAATRGSPADFQAQVLQVKGVLGRALYDAYFLRLGEGRTGEAGRLAAELGADLGLPEGGRRALSSATRRGEPGRARAALEGHLAGLMKSALASARGASSRGGALLGAARAAGAFLVVQDSPRAGTLSSEGFAAAISRLAAGDTASFRAAVDGLILEVEAFGRRARDAASEPALAPSQPELPAVARSSPASAPPRPSAPQPETAAPSAWAAVRGVALLALALAFALPLGLLALAFGGRDRHWRLVGLSIALLVLPPLLEGLAWLGGSVGGLELPAPSTLGAAGGLLWPASLALALGCATTGLLGIARQLGLVGPRPALAGSSREPAAWEEDF